MLEDLVSYLLLGVATNIDNFIIGVSYGLAARRIHLRGNLLIAVCNAIATFISVWVGDFLRRSLSQEVGELLSGVVFLSLGVLTISETYLTGAADEAEAGSRPSRPVGVSYQEIVTLGLSLSVTNLTGGIGAGLAGFPAVRLTLLMFVFSILPISLGQWVGQHSRTQFPYQWANVTAATLLAGFGVWKLMHGTVLQ